MSSFLLQKLALERCRLHVSQICAIVHLTNGPDSRCQRGQCSLPENLHGLFENLNRDLRILEGFVDDDL